MFSGPVSPLPRPWGAKMNELFPAETTVRECIGDGNYFVLESQFENCTKQFAVPRMQKFGASDRTDDLHLTVIRLLPTVTFYHNEELFKDTNFQPAVTYPMASCSLQLE